MLLDIGVGLLMAMLIGKMYALQMTLYLAAAGVFFSLLIDADAAIDFIIHRGTKHSYRHRDLFHLPLIYIPLGMVVIGLSPLPLSFPLSLLFGLCSIIHFIHDSIGLGWGVKWLYPFTSDQYSFFYQYNVHKTELRPHKYGFLYIWKSGEIDTLEKKYGDIEWFSRIYGTLHPYSMAEMAVFIFSLALFWLIRTN